MSLIEFEAKTDRELLLLVAQNSNVQTEKLVKVVECIEDHEKRIDTLEKQEPPSFNKKIKNNAIIVGIALGISAAVTTLFKKFGW